jgi:hypothetical protein
MADRPVVKVYRAFHNDGFAGLDAGDKLIIARKRIFDVAGFAYTIGHLGS